MKLLSEVAPLLLVAQVQIQAVHRGAFCQLPFWWIYYYGSNKSTGKETFKTHLCAVWHTNEQFSNIHYKKCIDLKRN